MTAIDRIELTGGRWVHTRAGLRVWVKDKPLGDLAPGPCINCGQMAIGLRCRPCRDDLGLGLNEAHKWEWDEQEQRAAHAAHARGKRDDWAVTGHRIYCRNRKREARRRVERKVA